MIEHWEKEEGVKFLRRIGMKPGQKVLDFGARVGNYTIPAAIVVGERGLVYAVDKERSVLDELKRKAAFLGLGNVRVIYNSGGVKIDLENESLDFVLLYDVLHYLKTRERKILYSEIYRVLEPDGLLSVYPKHVIEDFPLDEFRTLHLEDVKQEIMDSSFAFQKKYCGMISHDGYLNEGCVLNFWPCCKETHLN